MTGERPKAREPRRLPWLIGVIAAAVYLATLQRQLFNDGIFFEHKLRLGGEHLLYNHILYLPLVKLLQVAVSPVVAIDGETALKIFAALVGGAGVGLTYVVARECLDSVRRGVACAVLTGSCVAYWLHSTATELHGFHAACATVLLLALFRVLHHQRLDSFGSCAFLALGVAITPASHFSGICAGLPLLYVWWQAGPARLRYSLSVGVGVLIFAAAYSTMAEYGGGFDAYASAHSGKHDVLWNDPAKVPHLIKVCFAELTLYTAPAAALIPAGLRILFRTAPVHAWFCLCWLVAWPLVAWPVEDRLYGGYYTPTVPVQALLALVAVQGVCRTWGRAWLVAVLGILPMLVYVFAAAHVSDPDAVALSVTGACAFALLLLAGQPSGALRGVWILPVLAFVTTAPHILNVRRLDRHRDRIHEVAEIVARAEQESGQRALLLFLATDTNTNHHWKHFFPGAFGDETRAFNPLELAFQYATDELATRRLARFQAIVIEARRNGRPVFVEGPRERALAVAAGQSSAAILIPFFTQLDQAFVQEAGGLPGLHRLTPRD